MFKKIFLIFILSLFLPAIAGEYEDAIKSNNYVLLYMYTPKCGYCAKFNPIYNKIKTVYGKKYKFVKVDASTEYGKKLMWDCGAYYIPYVLLVNNQTRSIGKIQQECLFNYACMQHALDNFSNRSGGTK